MKINVDVFVGRLESIIVCTVLKVPFRNRLRSPTSCRASATNSTLDIYDLFLIYLRFTAKDFCISRLTEYTSITIQGTVFYRTDDSQSTKKPDHGVTKIPLPPLLIYMRLFKNLKARILKSVITWSAMGNQTAQAKEVYRTVCEL